MDAPSPDDPEENPLVKLTSLFVLGAGLLALFTGQNWFWMIFALGFAVLVPLVKLVGDAFGVEVGADEAGRTESDRAAPESKQDALDALRDRYARGELSETEFERKVETLLETETLESARKHVGCEVSADTDRETDAETELGASADTERATERR